jgi:hypothetical protein
MEGTTERMMMIERLGRSDGAMGRSDGAMGRSDGVMADDKEVENFHLDTKHDNK